MSRFILGSVVAISAGCSQVPGDAALRSGHPQQATKLYETGYRNGDAEAGLRLAALLRDGSGVPKDERKAFELYSEIAAKGTGDAAGKARLQLAEMYSQGTGVAKDERKAFELYSEIAAQGKGNAAVYHNLGVFSEYGRGGPVDYAKAAQWYQRAADQNYLWSVYNLGTLYANNRLTPADDVKGLTFLLRAVEMAKSAPRNNATRFIIEDEPGHVKRMLARMAPDQIATARAAATAAAKTAGKPLI